MPGVASLDVSNSSTTLSRGLLILVVFHHPGCAVGQRPPQVGVPLWMPTQQRPPPAVGVASPLVLSLHPEAQGDSLLLPGGLFLLFRGSGHGQTKGF